MTEYQAQMAMINILNSLTLRIKARQSSFKYLTLQKENCTSKREIILHNESFRPLVENVGYLKLVIDENFAFLKRHYIVDDQNEQNFIQNRFCR